MKRYFHWTRDEDSTLHAMYEAGKTNAEIAAALGRTEAGVYARRKRFRLIDYDADVERRLDPTPDEIAAACERLQEGWTESERRKRAKCSDGPYEIPGAKWGQRFV